MIPRASIFVAVQPVDLRRSFDGLAGAARERMSKDPQSGALFLFINKARNRVKILWWDRTGFALLYKRLERGTFRIPAPLEPGASSVTIDVAELAKILEGVALPRDRWGAVRAA